jgi:uncharacterized damage-inducible protein DinB
MESGKPNSTTRERADFLDALTEHRLLLRLTVRNLAEEQAASHPTVSALSLGGIIKHVTDVESSWVDFIVNGPAAMSREFDEMKSEAGVAQRLARFQMGPGETLVDVLKRYEDAARRTDNLVATIPDFDALHPMPEAPWFPKSAHWSSRRVLLHIIAETSQHAGRADIIRESIDGSTSMA